MATFSPGISLAMERPVASTSTRWRKRIARNSLRFARMVISS